MFRPSRIARSKIALAYNGNSSFHHTKKIAYVFIIYIMYVFFVKKDKIFYF